MGLGVVLSFAASPAVAERIGLDSFHFATRQIVYMIPALVAMLAVSFLTPAAGPASRRRDARHLAASDGGGSVRRRGGEGRASLGVVLRRLRPAVRIPEAGIRRHLRLAVRREGAQPGNSGKHSGGASAGPGRGAAGGAARPRPDDPRHRHMGRHVLHGRHAVAVDHRDRIAGGSRRRRRLSRPSTTWPAASIAS